MRFTAQASSGGVTEHRFALPVPEDPGGGGEVPGVLWTPGARLVPRGLVLLGHGGGEHKQAPGVVATAHRLVAEGGFAVVALDAPGHGDRPADDEQERIGAQLRSVREAGGDVTAVIVRLHAYLAARTVPEWRAVLDAGPVLDRVGAGPVGYWGVSMGCGLGIPLMAAEPRIRAAVLGLNGAEISAEDAARVTVPVEFLVQWDDELVPREEALALFDRLGSAEKALHANPGGHGQIPAFELESTLRFFARHLLGEDRA